MVVAGRSRVAIAGPQNLQMAIRTGASNFFSSNVTVGTGFGPGQNVWDLNPDTGLPWTNAEVDALEGIATFGASPHIHPLASVSGRLVICIE